MRLERPLPLDLRAIAEGVIKNNMGIGGIEVRVRGTLDGGQATLLGTGQQIPVIDGPPRSTAPWLWLQARDYGLGHADAVTWLRESAAPTLAAQP